jgi:hypothetical protein
VAVVLGLGLWADFGSLGEELRSFRWELFPLALALTAQLPAPLLPLAALPVQAGDPDSARPQLRDLRRRADDDDHAREARRAAQVRPLEA